MKVLVCGASGLLGRDLCKLLRDENIEYIGTYYDRRIDNGIQVNFMDTNDIEHAFIEHNITVCVNCIVERQVDTCENDWLVIKKINIDIAANIAKACNKNNTYMVHISTDYVFDGKNAPYYPDSPTNPLQNYGISKLISENRVSQYAKNYTIVRVPVLYSDTSMLLDENAVTLVGKKVLNRITQTKEDNYSVRRPNYIPDFCRFLLDIICSNHFAPPLLRTASPKVGGSRLQASLANRRKAMQNLQINRIYHFNNPHDNVTKYEMATMISNYLHKDNHIAPIDEEPNDGVDRPRDTYLMDNQYNINDYTFTPLQEGLERCFRKLWHPKLDFTSEENTKDIFFLLDLDGTLIDSEKSHYLAYLRALKGLYALNWQPEKFTQQKFNDIINGEGMDAYIYDMCKSQTFLESTKQLKNIYMKNELTNVELMPGADALIDYIHTYNINHAVVTNTSKENVELFMKKQPKLQLLKNWITREDYTNPKPDGECFLLGLKKFHQGEPHVIGVENTISGHQSLEHATKCIYMMMDKKINMQTSIAYSHAQKQDVYIIDDFEQLCK